MGVINKDYCANYTSVIADNPPRKNKFTNLELSQHVNENASVKHGLDVHGGDEVLDLLECEASELLHDLGRPLHLLTLEREQGLLRVVQLLKVGPVDKTSFYVDLKL